jgi:uncharacterized membrane protein YkvA (DUF1232 family)
MGFTKSLKIKRSYSQIKNMLKIIATILAIVYAIWPFDLIPNFIVGLGWIDDILVLPWSGTIFTQTGQNHQVLSGNTGQQHDYYQRQQYGNRQQGSAGNSNINNRERKWEKKTHIRSLVLEKTLLLMRSKKLIADWSTPTIPIRSATWAKNFRNWLKKNSRKFRKPISS